MPVLTNFDSLNPPALTCGMISLFLRQVDSFPDQLAFVDAVGDTAITYSELLGKVKALACELRRSTSTIQLEAPIAILTAKGLDNIVAQLAVVFVGGSCVPLDPSISDEHIKIRLDDCQPLYLILDEENQHRLLGDAKKITIAHTCLHWSGEECLPAQTYPETRSHIIYTSGTTGKPKGVQVLAQGLYRTWQWANMKPHDLVGHVTNPMFDVSTLDIWATLASGATIVHFSKDILSSPFTFADALRHSRISWMTITAGLFNIVAFACPEAFSSIKVLISTGEAANSMAMKAVLKTDFSKSGKLFNAYGPTECSVWCAYHEVTLEEATSGSISIGKPMIGSDLYVLDDDLQPVSGTVIGELCVGGIGLSRGYLNRPDLTEKAFVSLAGHGRVYRTGDLVRYNKFGVLDYIGRKDNQVKIHGFRVELEGVEAALIKNCASAVTTAVVLKLQPRQQKSEPEDLEDSAFLLAFIVLKPDQEDGSLKEVSKRISEVLPWYSVPRLQAIDQFPLNGSGKVDRKKLAELYYSSSVKLDPESRQQENSLSTMEKLQLIWHQTLARPTSAIIKPTDNYFFLGGTSMQSAALILKIRKQFGIALTTEALFRHQTLLEMTNYLDHAHDHVNTADKSFDAIKNLMKSDALLSENLEALEGPVPDWRSDGNVFVTGATGFLGAYLVHSLLQMPEIKKVQCLVRAKNVKDGLSRIQESFAKYGIACSRAQTATGQQDEQESLMSKLVVLPGDLVDPTLGLGQAGFNDLANSCAAIFHFGALVNYVQPYTAHRPANTIGTLNIIGLAVTGRPKAIHYSSSFVAHGPTGLLNGPKIKSLPESEPLEPYLEGLMYDLGYSQSQWVAEQLLWKAIRKGIPIAIYRPGFILGHSKSGYGNPDDFMGRLVISCIKMGSYPLLPNQKKEFIPVDHCVRDLLHISSSNKNLGRAYAIVPLEPAKSPDWNDTFELLKQSTNGGINLRGLPYMEWVNQLPEIVDKRLQPLMPLFREKVYGDKTRWEVYENMPIYQTDNTRRALANSDNPEGCCGLNEGLLKLYLKGWFEQTKNFQFVTSLTGQPDSPVPPEHKIEAVAVAAA
ncbi:hypothetical protein TWF506_003745 [Arthrobotrys conoides]|uniref:Carrier domain-containing protein n=1 Tax=Arthrobotrys conoides TaxID=74498 RepID=A0AAN8RQN4_9PEZI